MSKNQIYNLIIACVLFVLVVLRILGDVDSNVISCFNFVGMVIALISVLFKIENNALNRKKPIWFGFAILCMIIASIFAVLIFSEQIVLGTTANDVITLFALFFSLPADLYVALFSPKKNVDATCEISK